MATTPQARSLVARHPSVEPGLGDGGPQAAQRARLLEAMAQTVADKGYPATTVADVVSAARVSRSTFYELFASKEQCFVEAYLYGVDVILQAMRAAGRGAREQGWEAELRASNLAYLQALADEPRFARTYLLEIHRAGDEALDARAQVLDRFAARLRRMAARVRPDQPAPPREAVLVLAAGLDQLAAEWLREGRAARLPELEPTFTHCARAILAAGGGGDA